MNLYSKLLNFCVDTIKMVWYSMVKFKEIEQRNKASRNTLGKPRGLHASDTAVRLTDVSDRACEELGNPAKQMKKARTAGQESKVSSLFEERWTG